MPQIGFICTDGQKVTHEECLEHPCRLGERCLSHGYLALLKPYKAWSGKVSVTQLLQPVLIQWLQIKRGYYVLPARQHYRLLGTKVHLKLSLTPSEITDVEQHCGDQNKRGIWDAYERELGMGILYDHKVVGSYQMAKYLKGDMWDAEMQLNMYRVFCERAGLRVDAMKIQAIPRDGGLEVSKMRGQANIVRPIPVRRLPDSYVVEWFDNAQDQLLLALASDDPPPKCSYDETWKGRRCSNYCDVNGVCPYVGVRRKK